MVVVMTVKVEMVVNTWAQPYLRFWKKQCEKLPAYQPT
jgi:hypothetical protein